VRRGDTLLRIATFFGIAPADILRLNPAIADPAIVVRGSTLVLPTPTR
jgi:LysM repeat protein